MSGARSLLELVRALLERTYRIETGLDQLATFVIGDQGYRLLYDARDMAVRSAQGWGAKTLVRQTAEGVRAAVYFPDAQIRRLEQFPPQMGLGEENVDAFATLVEEIDHLLLIAERARLGRTLTLLELELHANVSKYLVLTRFLAGRRPRLGDVRRLWLRHHLFEKHRFCDDDEETRRRYEDAARWAVKLIDALPALRTPSRLRALRRFHAATTRGKLRLITTLTA